MPSNALTPVANCCGGRIAGAALNVVSGLPAWALWQSTQVACRLLLSTGASAASCTFVPEGRGWLTFTTSAMMFGAAGDKYVPPAWQVKQFCITGSYEGATGVAGRNSRAGATQSCSLWQEVQAFTPTVGYEPACASGETWFVAV